MQQTPSVRGGGRIGLRRGLVSTLAAAAMAVVATACAPVVPPPVVEPTGTLPLVTIDTDGGAPILDRENYIEAQFEIDANGHPGGDAGGILEIRGRGNSTWTYPKKPFKLKLDEKAPLLGMTSNKHWALLANHLDRSHLRTEAAFALSEATGLGWTPRAVHVDLVLNGEYLGVYQLVEHVRIDPLRVDIDDMEPEDLTGEALTGGYLLEVDAWGPGSGEPVFVTNRMIPVTVKKPEPPEPAQMDYIRSYVQAFEDALFSPGFTDPTTGYRAYLDVDSLVDWYLVHELTRSQDAFVSSTKMYKPRNGKLTFGPVWDFDLSMGSHQGWDSSDPAGWWVRRERNTWITRLFEDPAFEAKVSARWDELEPAFSAVAGALPARDAAMDPVRTVDGARWGWFPGQNDNGAYLGSWLTQRIAWLDANL